MFCGDKILDPLRTEIRFIPSLFPLLFLQLPSRHTHTPQTHTHTSKHRYTSQIPIKSQKKSVISRKISLAYRNLHRLNLHFNSVVVTYVVPTHIPRLLGHSGDQDTAQLSRVDSLGLRRPASKQTVKIQAIIITLCEEKGLWYLPIIQGNFLEEMKFQLVEEECVEVEGTGHRTWERPGFWWLEQLL